MAKTIQVRVDERMKAEVEELFSELGLDVSTAVRMFFAAAIREQGLPINAGLYNEETIQARKDAEAGRNLVGPFDTVEEAIASMLADDEDDELTYDEEPAVRKVAENTDYEYKV